MEIFHKWFRVLINPKETLGEEKEKATLKEAVAHVGIAGLIVGIIVAICTIGGLIPPSGITTSQGLYYVLLFPLIFISTLLISSLFFFLFATLLGGKGDYTTQTYLISLYSAPLGMLEMVPFLNILAGIYGICLLVLTLKETHNLSTGRSVVGWLVGGLVGGIVISIVFSFAIPVILGLVIWQDPGLGIQSGVGLTPAVSGFNSYIKVTEHKLCSDGRGMILVKNAQCSPVIIRENSSGLNLTSRSEGLGAVTEEGSRINIITPPGADCYLDMPDKVYLGPQEEVEIKIACPSMPASPGDPYKAEITLQCVVKKSWIDEGGFPLIGSPCLKEGFYLAPGPLVSKGSIAGFLGAPEESIWKNTITQYHKTSYTWIKSLTEVNGRLTYEARRGGRWFIVYGGEELGMEYNYVGSPTEVNETLVYVACEIDECFIVYGGGEGKRYNKVSSPTEVNGTLAYIANDGDKEFVVYGGKESEKYRRVISLTEVNGKLAYSVVVDQPYTHIRIRYEDNEVETTYYAECFAEINGELAFLANEGGKYFIVYKGKEGKRYVWIDGYIAEVNGKLTYSAEEEHKQEERKQFVVYGGEEGERYDDVSFPIEVNGTLVYIAEEGGRECIVYGGEEGESYGGISSLTEVNGRLVFAAKKNGEWYIVQEL